MPGNTKCRHVDEHNAYQVLDEITGRSPYTPLTRAARDGHVGAVKTLLALKADVMGGEWDCIVVLTLHMAPAKR